MKDVLLIYFFVCLCSLVVGEDFVDEYLYAENTIDASDVVDRTDFHSIVQTPNCWMGLNAAEHFKILDAIDARYAKVREEVQQSLKEIDFDNAMIHEFKESRGVAIRESHAHNHQTGMIPSGLNLGGFCMLRMPESLLFFHRMKLRNNTYFRVNFLYNDLSNMIVTINLSLNDLHLKGAFERTLTEKDPSILTYAPTYGLVEFLLKDVKYKIEGRYRLINNKLLIELVSSEIVTNEILMTYLNRAIESSAIRVHEENLGSFLSRMKTDLDKWIKDYFNDYLVYADLDGIPNIKELAKYDKEKGTALEEFTDNSIQAIANRIRHLNADSISLPSLTFRSIQGMQLKLYQGVVNGLDSMYRRSVATGYKKGAQTRKVDSIVGFSNLKVVYRYEAAIPTGVPPLTGTLTLTANELTAHLSLTMVADPESVDLDIEILDQMKPEALTVEGAANVMISTFKHLLEHQVVATMSNTLIHGIVMLKSLPSCNPFVPFQIENRKGPVQPIYSSSEDSENSESEEMLRDPFVPGQIESKKGPIIIKHINNNYDSEDSESEEMLRGKTDPQRRSSKYPKSLMKQSNRSVTKKNQKELNKYKGKGKKIITENKT